MSNPLRISLVLPFPVTKPVGGAKVMYEYANRLAARGHSITIYHSVRRPFKKSSTPAWLKKFIFLLRGVQRPRWFPLDKKIQSVIVNEISDRYLADADIVMGTWWQMAYALDKLSPEKGKKFNLIQDYEVWTGGEDLVIGSYRLNIVHIAIAKYLFDLVRSHSNREVHHIPNAIDASVFFQDKLPAERHPASVIMMYSKEKRKGSEFGIEALAQLKKEFPGLKITLFSVYPKPDDLPFECDYHQRPSNLRELLNASSVFITPSLGEGWALPPAEAMACGCALVCTNIGGHLDYAENGNTALLANPGDGEDLTAQIRKLINNNELRVKISEAGRKNITTNFSWDQSLRKLELLFQSKC